MIAFFKERLPGGRQGEEVQALQGGAGQAQEVWQEMQPSLVRVGRLEVSWWRPVQS